MKNIFFVALALLTMMVSADAKTHHHRVKTAAPTDAAVCMAQAMYHEARNEVTAGQIAVGNVIMNRVKSGGYPATVCGVVYDRCQFSFACRREVNIDWQRWSHLLELSKQVIAGDFADYSKGAMSFNNRPFKNRGLVKTTKIGHHYFYKTYARLGGNKEI